MENIIKKIQINILDNNENSILYSYTKIGDYIVLHIYNPNSDKIILNEKNKQFYFKLVKSLFNKQQKNIGCFNHESDDNDYKYNMSDKDLVNYFLQIEYSFIMINKHLEPLCNLCISDLTICNVCTDFLHQKKGLMSYLLKHILKLIRYNKLKIKYNYSDIRLNIRKKNPLKNVLIKYYSKYGFKLISDNSEYFVMKLN